MDVVRVETNRSCSLRCSHCSCSTREDPAIVRGAPRAIAEALRDDPRVLVFSGGEPLRRRDLERLVAFAKRSRSADQETAELGPRERRQVLLETSAVGLTEPRAQSLREAGVDRLRVRLPGWGPVYDQITGIRGSFALALAGMKAATAAGLPLEAEVPVLRANLDTLAKLPAQLREQDLELSTLWLRLPGSDPDPVRLRDAVTAIDETATALRALPPPRRDDAHPTRLRLAAGGLPPPCMFDRPDRVAHAYALDRGATSQPGYARRPGCEGCTIEDRCPGFPTRALEREPDLEPAPITTQRIRRKLSVVRGVDDQIARELVSREPGRDIAGNSWLVHTIRVQFACNQACEFCFVSTHLPNPPHAAVLAAIDQAAREGAHIALSGGEPTLNPRLPEYLRHAKNAGIPSIELQTNAIRLADPQLAQTVIEAGVDTAFVSLHGSRPEICDPVTGAPGTWAKTVAGVDQLARLGVRTRLNFVMCQTNAHDFRATVELVAERWPDFDLTFSFVSPSTDLVPRTSELIPRYSDVTEPLLDGLRRARELNLRVAGFESMCSIPLCLKPDGLDDYEQLEQIGEPGEDFEKPPVCEDCRERTRCWGLRRGYLSLYGATELRPLS
ncbi:MAG: radical SAM protein [Myxococcota bacterium]